MKVSPAFMGREISSASSEVMGLVLGGVMEVIVWPLGAAMRWVWLAIALRIALVAFPFCQVRSISRPPRAQRPRKVPVGKAEGRAGRRRTTLRFGSVLLAWDWRSISMRPVGPPRLPSIWKGSLFRVPQTSNRLGRVDWRES